MKIQMLALLLTLLPSLASAEMPELLHEVFRLEAAMNAELSEPTSPDAFNALLASWISKTDQIKADPRILDSAIESTRRALEANLASRASREDFTRLADELTKFTDLRLKLGLEKPVSLPRAPSVEPPLILGRDHEAVRLATRRYLEGQKPMLLRIQATKPLSPTDVFLRVNLLIQSENFVKATLGPAPPVQDSFQKKVVEKILTRSWIKTRGAATEAEMQSIGITNALTFALYFADTADSADETYLPALNTAVDCFAELLLNRASMSRADRYNLFSEAYGIAMSHVSAPRQDFVRLAFKHAPVRIQCDSILAAAPEPEALASIRKKF